MAIPTKVNIYLAICLIVSLLIFGLVSTGTALLSKSRINLDASSEAYINMMVGQDMGTDTYTSADRTELEETNLIEGDVNTSKVSGSDQFAVLNYFKEKASFIITPLQVVYNVPTIILVSLGLPLSAFAGYINAIVYVLVIGIGLAIWSVIK